MKLIVGLGNPGIEYQFTPHNLGFLTIDRIAEHCGVEVRNRQCRALTARTQIGEKQVLLAKPETFMNLSGLSVRELVAKYEMQPGDGPDRDLRRTGFAAGHDSHPAARAVRRATTGWSRSSGRWVRRSSCGSGWESRPRRKIADGVKYVLTPFSKSQLKMVDEVLDTAAEAVKVILTEGPAAAMNRFNRKAETEDSSRGSGQTNRATRFGERTNESYL